MSKATQQEVLDVIGEKWVITYTLNGREVGGMCNHHKSLPQLISAIRADGGMNIKIIDKTIFFVDNQDD